MGLESQNVPIALGQGVDTKTDPKQVIPGKMLVLQNCSLKSPKQIQKRDGFSGLSANIIGGGTISQGVGISGYQNELICLDGSSLYSYSPSQLAWKNQGTLIPVSLSVDTVVRNTNTQNQPDSAFHSGSGLQCFIWIDIGAATAIRYSVVDTTTGLSIVNDGLVDSLAVTAKVLTVGSFFIIIYYDSTGILLRYKTINTATPSALSVTTTIASDIESNLPAYDATIINGSVYLVYQKTGGTSQVFYSISTGLVLSSPYTLASGKFIDFGVCIKGDASNNVWIAFMDASTPKVWGAVVNSALNSTILAITAIAVPTGSQPFSNITMSISGTTATIYYEQTKVQSNYISFNTLTITGTVGTAAILLYRMGLASKIFVYNGNSYFLGVYSTTTPIPGSVNVQSIEQTYFLIKASSGQVIAKLAPSLAGTFYSSGLLPDVSLISSTKFSIPYLTQDDLSSLNGNIFYLTGVSVANFDFSIPYPMSKLNLGQNLLLASGQVWQYDGATVLEQGFHLYPDELTDVLTTSGGGIGSSLNTGSIINQIQYCAVYEWQDNQGQINRSATSPVLNILLPPASTLSAVTFTANSAAGSSQLLSVSSISGLFAGQVISDVTNATNFPSGTYIVRIVTATSVLLSSPAIGTHNGDTYSTKDICSVAVTIPTLTATSKSNISVTLYRTENNQSIFYRVSSLTNLTFNTFTAETVTITDTYPDSAIVGNEQLYTTGGELSNFNAPACSSLVSFKNRAAYLSPENPLQAGYSKQVIPGSPVEFSSLFFNENVDQRIGRISAHGVLDDKWILFGPNVKFYIVGDGPSPNGQNNDFTEATKIAGISGCTNPASIIEIPTGLCYQDPEKGIFMLDRSLQERFIGADVNAYAGFQVTSAILVPNSNKVMFTLSSGTNLTYDYYVEQWEIDVFSSGAIDSTIFENNVVYIQANGVSEQQTQGVFNDNGALIPIAFTTGWLSFAGINGFQRVWELEILGTYKSPHTLNIQIFTDYSSTPVQVTTIPVLSDPGLYEYRIHMAVQKCTAMQIQLSETQSGSIGEGFSLSSLGFRVGVKKGQNKLPAGSSY